MYSLKILASKVVLSMLVSAVMFGFIKYGPVELRGGTVTVLLVILSTVANDLKTYIDGRKDKDEQQS